MKTDEEIKELCDRIREQAYDLHQWLRHGHLEKVYENGMRNRIRRLGIQVEQQHPIQVADRDGSILGDFLADLFVDDELIIELKASKAISDEHVAQLLGYLRASGKRHGLLINFGSPTLQLKKLVL
ncbi:MAG: GxxExxY protein [Luteolibacter sp.]